MKLFEQVIQDFWTNKSIEHVDVLIQRNLNTDLKKVVKERNAWLKKWTDRAKQLHSEESKLHDSLEPHCATVLKGKRLLLFGEMLDEIKYPDKHLISDICHGFRVMGWLRDSCCFTKLPKQPSMSVKALIQTARGLNAAVLAKAASNDKDGLVQAAWDETQLELERGWIWKDGRKDFSGLSLTHRFGLQQKKKVRVIDNFKTSGVNATCGMREKQKLFGLDFIPTTLVRALSLGANRNMSLEGKTFDLSSAYKQFPLHCDDRSVLRIAVPVPGEKTVRGVWSEFSSLRCYRKCGRFPADKHCIISRHHFGSWNLDWHVLRRFACSQHGQHLALD